MSLWQINVYIKFKWYLGVPVWCMTFCKVCYNSLVYIFIAWAKLLCRYSMVTMQLSHRCSPTCLATSHSVLTAAQNTLVCTWGCLFRSNYVYLCSRSSSYSLNYHRSAMTVFCKLCTLAQSLRMHRTESVSVIGRAWWVAVSYTASYIEWDCSLSQWVYAVWCVLCWFSDSVWWPRELKVHDWDGRDIAGV